MNNDILYISNNESFAAAAEKTTHLAIGAHPDDIEFFAYHGILTCYESEENNFSGITLCDGAGSQRAGRFANYSDEKMIALRKKEQIEAAKIGKYVFQVQLGLNSKELKEGTKVVEKIKEIIEEVRPEVIYTHNLADKHETHVAAALRVLQALDKIKDKSYLKKIYGCEIWRDLDWLPDDKKIRLDVSAKPELALALCQVYKSQIEGGKKYDEAVMARRKAHAVFDDSHKEDQASAYTFAIDYSAIVFDGKNPQDFISELVKEFQSELASKIKNYEL